MQSFLGVFSRLVRCSGVGDVESVLQIAGGMLLGDVEGVKVPEASFNVTGRG